MNSSEVIVLPEKNKVVLSQIFNWYNKDFGGREGIQRFLLRYLDRDKIWWFIHKNWSGVTLEYLFYDWNLNH